MSQGNDPEKDERLDTVRHNIRSLRKARNMSVVTLAAKADISHSHLFYIESGRKSPTVSMLYKIADALGVPVTDFFIPVKESE